MEETVLSLEEKNKKILVFGGTTEGRAFLSYGLPCVYSAATDYGAELAELTKSDEHEILCERLDADGMAELVSRADIACAVDATHPYAAEVSRNIAVACAAAKKPLFRIEREASEIFSDSDILSFSTCTEAAEYLARVDGNALVATGSKEMHVFTEIPGYRERIYFRVLPTSDVILRCERLDVSPSRIIAEQGPFSEFENRAHLKRANARYLVTKDGGPQGGAEEKFRAAKSLGVGVLLIERPNSERGDESTESADGRKIMRGSLSDALRWAGNILGLPRCSDSENFERPSPDRPVINVSDSSTHSESEKYPLFPMFVDLSGKRVLVAGGGRVALRKARTLLACGASLLIVAPEIAPGFDELSDSGRGVLVKRGYTCGDMDGVDIAIAATNDREVNRRVALDANGIPVNVADDRGECSFFFPAFVEHDGYVAGISSGGRSPAKSRALAEKLRAVWKDWCLIK